MYRFLKPSIILAICYSGAAQQPRNNILAFGAVSDGRTVSTQYIQKAIDDCAGKGGGTVVIPPGRFITGTLSYRPGWGV